VTILKQIPKQSRYTNHYRQAKDCIPGFGIEFDNFFSKQCRLNTFKFLWRSGR